MLYIVYYSVISPPRGVLVRQGLPLVLVIFGQFDTLNVCKIFRSQTFIIFGLLPDVAGRIFAIRKPHYIV